MRFRLEARKRPRLIRPRFKRNSSKCKSPTVSRWGFSVQNRYRNFRQPERRRVHDLPSNRAQNRKNAVPERRHLRTAEVNLAVDRHEDLNRFDAASATPLRYVVVFEYEFIDEVVDGVAEF